MHVVQFVVEMKQRMLKSNSFKGFDAHSLSIKTVSVIRIAYDFDQTARRKYKSMLFADRIE